MCSFYLLSLAVLSMGCRHGNYMANFLSGVSNLFNTKLFILRKGLCMASEYLRIIDLEFKQFYFSNTNVSPQIFNHI